MMRALGDPHKDDTQLVHSIDELVRQCLLHHRAAVVEKARGREATLEVAPLRHEQTGVVEAVAVLGTCSAESGSKESEQIVARQNLSHFVLFTQRSTMGADARVRRAVRLGDSGVHVAVNGQGHGSPQKPPSKSHTH